MSDKKPDLEEVRKIILTGYVEILRGILERDGDEAAEMWLFLTSRGMGISMQSLARMTDEQLLALHPDLRRTHLISDD